MDPTTKFLNARPYAVLPVSPALAALYSSHSSSADKTPNWCSKCGSYLLNGGSHVRIHKVDVTIESERTTIDVHSQNALTLTTRPSSSTSSPLISPSHLPTPSSTIQESPAPGKVRSKKKSGLQLLLLKNREKEIQERKSNPTSGGLAAFLSGFIYRGTVSFMRYRDEQGVGIEPSFKGPVYPCGKDRVDVFNTVLVLIVLGQVSATGGGSRNRQRIS
ncbi:hypothetical protein E4T56_gene12509 [Termitomyces sp. T112]|nr:hypothetical protein E4T56_gene12509 [Termitomyces sp. T112]